MTTRARATEILEELRRIDRLFVWVWTEDSVSFGYHGDLRDPPPTIALPYKFDDPLPINCLEWYLKQAKRGT